MVVGGLLSGAVGCDGLLVAVSLDVTSFVD